MYYSTVYATSKVSSTRGAVKFLGSQQLHAAPDGCGSVGWALSCERNGRWSDPWSGYMPRLRVCPCLGHIQEATERCFPLASMFLSLSPSLPLSLKIMKSLKKKKV